MSFSTIQKGDLLDSLIKLRDQMKSVAHEIRDVYDVDNRNAEQLDGAANQVNGWANDLISEIHDS